MPEVLVKVKGARKSTMLKIDHPVAATEREIDKIASRPGCKESHGFKLVSEPTPSAIYAGGMQSGGHQFRRGKSY